MKYIYHIKENKKHTKCEHSNIDDCMNELMQHLFNILGNGDNENGGMGSLWRCAQSIYDTLRNGSVYEYANCKFWVEFVDETSKETTKQYIIHYPAVTPNLVTLNLVTLEESENYKELKKR